MLRSWIQMRLGTLPFVAFVAVGGGCSGTVIESSPEGEVLDGSGGRFEGSGGGSSGGNSSGGGGSGGTEASTGGVTYIEPECPDVPVKTRTECDPLRPYADCEEGLGCYPYLEYPAGEGCGNPAFGAVCIPTSKGEQGDFCGENLGYCSPGFMCVVGAAGGARCGKICQPVADHQCPEGFVCGETDVQGYGVCF